MPIAHVDQTTTKNRQKDIDINKDKDKYNKDSDDFPPGQGGDPSDLIEAVEKEEETTRSCLHIDSLPQDFHL